MANIRWTNDLECSSSTRKGRINMVWEWSGKQKWKHRWRPGTLQGEPLQRLMLGRLRTGPAVMTSCSLWPVFQSWCPQLPSQCLTGKGHAWAWKVRGPPPSIPYSWILAQFQSLFSWPYMGKQRTKLKIGCELSDTGCASQKCSRFGENTLICFQ